MLREDAKRREEPPSRRWNLPLLLTLIGCAAIGALLIPPYRHALNPDGISYLAVAEHLAAFRIHEAVNAYWSPLLSWLLAPLLLLGVNGLVASKLIAILTSLATAVFASRLCLNLGQNRGVACGVAFVAFLISLAAGFLSIHPDPLMAAMVLAYLVVATNPRYGSTWRSSLATGLVAGLGYFAKLYFLPFFVAHLLLDVAARVVLRRWSLARSARHVVVASATLAVLVAAWGGVLGWKYGTFTLGSALRYNFSAGSSMWVQHPMHTEGFLPPPTEHAHSAWDDPTYLVDLKRRAGERAAIEFAQSQVGAGQRQAPRSTGSRIIAGLLFRARHHAARIKDISVIWAVLTPAVIFFGFVLSLGGWRQLQERHEALVSLLLAVCVYVGGFLLVAVLDRYLVPVQLIVLVLTPPVVMAFLRGAGIGAWPLVALVLIASLASFTVRPLRQLEANRERGKQIPALVTALSEVLPPGATIGSDRHPGDNRHWWRSLWLAYSGKWRYYGEFASHWDDATALDRARALGIDYLLRWPAPARNQTWIWAQGDTPLGEDVPTVVKVESAD